MITVALTESVAEIQRGKKHEQKVRGPEKLKTNAQVPRMHLEEKQENDEPNYLL